MNVGKHFGCLWDPTLISVRSQEEFFRQLQSLCRSLEDKVDPLLAEQIHLQIRNQELLRLFQSQKEEFSKLVSVNQSLLATCEQCQCKQLEKK